jgi:hypothetical protein
MKETLLTWLFEQAKRYGATFVVLGIALYWITERLNEMDIKYEKAISTQIQYLKDDQSKALKVIENNTLVMERVLEELKRK